MIRNCNIINTSLNDIDIPSSLPSIHNEFILHHHVPIRMNYKKQLHRSKEMSHSCYIKKPYRLIKMNEMNTKRKNCVIKQCNVSKYNVKDVNEFANSQMSFMKKTKSEIISRNDIELNEMNMNTINNININNNIIIKKRKDILKGNENEIFISNYFTKQKKLSRDVKDIIVNEICNKVSKNRSAFIRKFLFKKENSLKIAGITKKHNTILNNTTHNKLIHFYKEHTNPYLYINRKINMHELINDSKCMNTFISNLHNEVDIQLNHL